MNIAANRNLKEDRPTFVTHMECGLRGDHSPADQVHGLSKAGKPLLVRSRFAGHRRGRQQRRTRRDRPADLWRYREFLPVRQTKNIVSLGEVHTPLVELRHLQAGTGKLLVKDEARLPTGSFKARGLCLAVSMAKELGITRVAMPTNGNAGTALAAYAAAAGDRSDRALPRRHARNQRPRDRRPRGSGLWANGLINDCGKFVGQNAQAMQWFDFHAQGAVFASKAKKRWAWNWRINSVGRYPDVIFYPTGGGAG